MCSNRSGMLKESICSGEVLQSEAELSLDAVVGVKPQGSSSQAEEQDVACLPDPPVTCPAEGETEGYTGVDGWRTGLSTDVSADRLRESGDRYREWWRGSFFCDSLSALVLWLYQCASVPFTGTQCPEQK